MTKNNMKFRLVLDVKFDPQGCTPEDLKANMNQVVRDSVNNGTLTGDLPATVETYNYSVKRIGGPRKKIRRYPKAKLAAYCKNRPPEPPSVSEPHQVLTAPWFPATLAP